MLQAALLDCPFLDPFPLFKNCFIAFKVDVCGCDLVQALVVTLIVVLLDECADLALKVAGQIVVIRQNAVFHGLVPAFYFAPRLRVEWRAADMLHALPLKPLRQIT